MKTCLLRILPVLFLMNFIHSASAEEWKLLKSFKYRIVGAAFYNYKIGYVIEEAAPDSVPVIGSIIRYNRKLYQTLDSGNTWIYKADLPFFGSSLSHQAYPGLLNFISSNTGTIQYYNKIWVTTNAGISWNEHIFSNSGGPLNLKNKDTLFFGNSSGPEISYDGGVSWNLAHTSLADIYNMQFITNKIGFGIKNSRKLYRTDNGGVTWTEISEPANYDINGMYFENVNKGYISAGNFIIQSTNGGINWSIVCGPDSRLNKLSYVADSFFYVDRSYTTIPCNSFSPSNASEPSYPIVAWKDFAQYGISEFSMYRLPMRYRVTDIEEVVIPIQNPRNEDTLSISGTVHQGPGMLTDGIVMAIDKTTNSSKILRVTNGNFMLDSLKRGEYILYAVPNPVTVTNYLPTFYVNKVHLKDAVTLSLRGHIRSVDIYLVPLTSTLTGTHTITGRFSYESGSSTDPASFKSNWFSQNNKTTTEIPITTQPCRQMPVLLLNSQNRVLKSVLTDSTGYFIVKNIPAGTYKLLGQRNGYASKNEGTVTVGSSSTEVANLRMEAVVTSFENEEELVTKPPLVFPNPFQHSFEIRGYVGDLVVYDITGRVFYQSFHNENESINTETWPAGFYFLKLGEKTEKLIKQD